MGNLQVRFLEGWAPAMAPGYSTLGTSGLPVRPESLANSKWSFRLPTSAFREIRVYQMPVIRQLSVEVEHSSPSIEAPFYLDPS